MRVVTSAKYETPIYDNATGLIKLVRRGFQNPEFTKLVKYVNREENKVYFFDADNYLNHRGGTLR